MKNRKVMFLNPWQVETVEEKFTLQIGDQEVLVKKLYTLISPGTELAMLSGNESWFRMPGIPGYAAVSEIVEVGAGVTGFNSGDIVFHYGNHTQYEVVSIRGTFLKVPDNLDLKWVPFTRMATVATTAIRVSNIEFGDYVSVTGLGLIGNMAAQLAHLQGATVIGIDLSEERLRIAKQCGVIHVISGGKDSVNEQIAEITHGKGVSTHIEATGVPQVAVQSLEWIAKLGEIIFLGSPRGEYNTDVTEILNYCHLYGRGCITFKGAHEWRYPTEPNEFVKHSLVRNSNIVFELMKQKRLQVEPLISHVLKPEEAKEAYEGLRVNKDQYSGVLFDWSET
ncbi:MULTISPECIES: zinc-dependent alcohol dehydrogenase [unclassified Paenibacillus]|uniref:zinc-dependent alcohol dehydrogenase n=1 Tax=unclassified Paenibacillus TaxID=185978 RepID=UPI000710D0FD|nr:MULTISPECIES: zinc-binding alcohol dehydrogenase [unclassified Paenibacillus]KQX45227.1 alcohol dehydrogenase [Paenibacillus sp. Root444D2]KRE45576.1 alcohol dehydrogenase [Paenibacillus sp. Soil724D2]